MDISDLEKLFQLKKKKIITSAEFKAQKEAILNASLAEEKLVRTEKNMPEKVFLGFIWMIFGFALLFMTMGLLGSPEMWEWWFSYRRSFFFFTGFFLLPIFILWVIAFVWEAFFIRSRYFAYYFLLIFGIALLGSISDYVKVN